MDFDMDDYSMDYMEVFNDLAEKSKREHAARENKMLDKMPIGPSQPGKLSLEDITKLCFRMNDWDYEKTDRGIFGGGITETYKGAVVIDKILEVNIDLCKHDKEYFVQAHTGSLDLGTYHGKKSAEILAILKPLYNSVEAIYDKKRANPNYFGEAKARIKKERDTQREDMINAVKTYLQ